MENKDKEAVDFLTGQGYVKTVTYPDKTTVEPTFQWATVIRLLQSYSASQNEELRKENEETKVINNSYAEKIKRQNERIKLLEEEIDGEEAISRDRAAAISQLQSTIDENNKEIERLKERIEMLRD